MQMIRRSEAVSKGLARYFTGRPCKRGHVSFRRTACSTCVDCWALASERMRRRNGSREVVRKFTAAEKRAMSNERVRRWIERHPDRYAELCREANRKRMEQYHADIAFREVMKAEARARARKYDRSEVNKRRRELYAADVTVVEACNARRRARGFGVTVDFSAADFRRIREESGGRCAYCLAATSLTFDHVEPLALGGPHRPDNIVMACRSCNSSKKSSPLLIFLMRRFG